MGLKKLQSIATKIAIFGGIGIFVCINAVPFIINTKIRKSYHYTEAIRLLHSHPQAIEYLGEPIKEKSINVTKKENYGTDGKKVWLVVPVTGSKDSGNLFYNFYTPENNNPVELSRVELILNNVKGYKLIIKRE